jgi:hypothetical protein
MPRQSTIPMIIISSRKNTPKAMIESLSILLTSS